MKRAVLLLAAGCLLLGPRAHGGAAHGASLPRGADLFFVEDDLVYARCLALRRDGTYQQIDKDPASASEVDGGTWDQAGGALRLRPIHHAMRPRALLAGPLCVVLDSQDKVEALAALASATVRFAASTQDRVFAARDAAELAAPPLRVNIPPGVETFSRADLASLGAQAADASASEHRGIFPLAILQAGGPILLVPQGAVYGANDLAPVRREYRVPPGAAPPFYFARVDARTFARVVGAWRTFHFVGQPD